MSTPEEQEQEVQMKLAEWEQEYGGLDRTSRMLEQLRETHSTGVDTLMKLGAQGEQMNRLSKLTDEQEAYVSKLGKYKKFNKYMKRLTKKEKELPPKQKEIHHEVNRLKVKHEVDVKIFQKRENDVKEKRERELEEQLRKQREAGNNPFSDPLEDEEEKFSKKSLSRLWKDDDPLSKEKKNQLNYAIQNQATPIDRLNEEDIKDNIFIKNATWIKQQDAQLDEMSDILGDLKNITIATHTELKTQNIKLDEIDYKMEKGSDFSLRRKSKRQIDKEEKKKEKEEKDRMKKEQKAKESIDKRVKKELNGSPTPIPNLRK
ncbi:hypothetical protein CYY_009137 [Polysphondylium violaceum]|uniref:t-SNARE coiled-coil homology domain-containing protein n=1 Tax=Polysphondylium violaceum TaxID=133409 RepID=A0A8J4PNB6_9MYCE|nr:hypothetical protein CYY_009137 [Polysphondylium violaceum]